MGDKTISAGDLFLHFGQIEEAERLVKTFHYSGRFSANIQLVGTFHLSGGLFGDMGEAVAAITFSIPPTRWSERVLELSRLVRVDGCRVPLTRLIALACNKLKRRGEDLLVSYADNTFNHHGGVYQAASWNYDGFREPRLDGIFIEGCFVPGRTSNSLYGTRSVELLRKARPELDIEPSYDNGKHLYWRALSKSGLDKAKRLGLKVTPYPKPTIDNNGKDSDECQPGK